MKKYIILTIVLCTAILASAHAQSYTFSNNLLVGSSGSDVTNLQTWLMSNGYDIPSISSGLANKGYFGSQTKLALIRYQQSLGFPAFGYFGPITRGYINGHSNPNNASFKITSPNGGETWVKGTSQNIAWSGSANVLAQKGDIKLEYPLPACAQPGQIIRCMIMVRAPLTIAQNVDLNSRSYLWNVGSVITGTTACMAGETCYQDPVSDGQYKIQICPADGSTCDESDSNFTISSNPVTGNTPVINGVDAPTTLSVGQMGTWTIRATDPLNGTLSYSVNWGDAPNCNYSYACVAQNAPLSYIQNSTFTHSYVNTGTYTVTFIVRNSSGQQVQTTSTVVVTGSTSAGPLKIISPNGGETWLRGTTQNITWTSPYYFRATTADLKLTPYQAPCTTQICPMYILAPYTIATGLSINQNSYGWNVGTALNYSGVSQFVPNGQYTIQICETGTSSCDSSDAVFNIVN
ncbi:MAG: peptidoglycan-binding protein [Patescibacteria group bacterium]